MAIIDIKIPEEVGDVEECVIVTWLKNTGDAVDQGEDLLILQAEKVSFEVPAPATGTLTAILAQQGDVVTRQQPLAQMEVTQVEEQPQPAQPAPAAAPTRDVRASPIAKRLAREHRLDLAQLAGSGPGGRITEKDVQTFLEARQAKPAETAATLAGEVRASPMAKRIAREHGLALRQITGTGSGGRITEKDVQTVLESRQATAAPTVIQTAEAKTAPTEASEARIPVVGIRAVIAQRMHQSLQDMAQLTLHTEADVTDLVALRQTLKQTQPVTYTDLIIQACAQALRRHPRLNATLEGDVIKLLPEVNIGLAVALDDGLIVPVIHETDKLSLSDLARSRIRLIERAHSGQLTKAEIEGGTFTVTNLGNYDIDAFTPIVNPPEAAILGVGRIVDKVVIHQAKIAQRSMMSLSLTFDHRVVDGAPAAAFLQTIKQQLEAPHQG